jgi:poly(A) polymerase
MAKKTVPASKYNVSNQGISADALYVIEKLQEHGYDGFIVGGGIRDLLLGKKPKDFDIVTNATPEMIRKVFRRNSLIIGRRFKIVHVVFENINPEKIVNNRPIVERHAIEVSTYRSHKVRNSNLSQHGRIMVDNEYGTQKEDAIRRDFTINALFYDPIAEVIVDYNDGLKDIQDKYIKIIGNPRNRYIEDPVRILRAIRLSAKLGLNIHKDTAKPFSEIKHLLANESRGRKYEEMLKILASGYSASCVNALKQLEIPREVFPLFDQLFFNNDESDKLALKILERTDTRIAEGNDISVVFMLAGLMWPKIYNNWHNAPHGTPIKQALIDSIIKNRSFALNEIGITKSIYTSMSDVWLLQLDLEHPNIKKIDNILNAHRFRQACYLYDVRNEINQVDANLHNWWQKLIEADEDNQEQLLHELKEHFNISSNRKRKRKSKKSLIKADS